MRICYLLLLFFLIIRRPPRSTRTDTLFPYTTLFRSGGKAAVRTTCHDDGGVTDEGPLEVVRVRDFGFQAEKVPYRAAKNPLLPPVVDFLTAEYSIRNERTIGSRKYLRVRSEERCVGTECVSTCRSRRSPDYKKKRYKHHYETH